MATMPRVRHIEEELRKAHMDPRVINVVCMLAERQRIQHQQMYEMATTIVRLQDLLSELNAKMGVRDANLRKLGIEEMIKEANSKGVSVDSVAEFDEDKGTH